MDTFTTWLEEPIDGDDDLESGKQPHGRSPLGMVTQAPSLQELVDELHRFRARFEADTHTQHTLRFTRARVEAARKAFVDVIRRGERRLHSLCALLCQHFLGACRISSVVIGEIGATGERFSLVTDVDPSEIYASTDLELGNHQLERMRFRRAGRWERTTLVSNAIEYQATESNQYSIFKILSRVKAEEEIWNKVTDEIFDLDGIVLRDKQLRRLSRYVKDVFGVKIVVGSLNDVYKVQKELAQLEWNQDDLRSLELPQDTQTRLEFVEVKDYVARVHRKRSGWSAMKSVVRFAGRTVEIQVQPLRNFLHERELLTRESHASFKSRREHLRAEVAQRIPLLGFYLDLLRWLFVVPEQAPPTHPRIAIQLIE